MNLEKNRQEKMILILNAFRNVSEWLIFYYRFFYWRQIQPVTDRKVAKFFAENLRPPYNHV